nr:DUF3108 domain-containing protein [uncultured Gellertiella sp.]
MPVKAWMSGLAALVVAGGVAAGPGEAAALTQKTEYRIAIGGLPVARAVFNTTLEHSRYLISGHVNTSGLVDLIADIKADTSVSGTMGGSGYLRAHAYDLTYSSGHKTRVYRVNFRGGRVTGNSIDPEPVRPPDWVPVTARQLTSVLDPISGLVFPEGKKVCPRSLPIFDGETRMDLKLSKKGMKPFNIDGYKGEALVCGVRFVPKGGYKQGRKDIEFLRKSSQMEIWFASAGNIRLTAPVYVRIPTQIGMLTISAHRISQ